MKALLVVLIVAVTYAVSGTSDTTDTKDEVTNTKITRLANVTGVWKTSKTEISTSGWKLDAWVKALQTKITTAKLKDDKTAKTFYAKLNDADSFNSKSIAPLIACTLSSADTDLTSTTKDPKASSFWYHKFCQTSVTTTNKCGADGKTCPDIVKAECTCPGKGTWPTQPEWKGQHEKETLLSRYSAQESSNNVWVQLTYNLIEVADADTKKLWNVETPIKKDDKESLDAFGAEVKKMFEDANDDDINVSSFTPFAFYQYSSAATSFTIALLWLSAVLLTFF